MSEIFHCVDEQCKGNFGILQQEREFYQRKSLPLPTFCPTCRHKQRMALRSERKLYRRECGQCRSKILSTYPTQAPYLIYCQDCFWKHIS